MNGAQLHLLVNHLPVVGFIGVTLGLVVAFFLKSADVKRFVLAATVLVGVSGLLPFATGEDAEEVVEHAAGVSEKLIHEHEEAAEFATILGLVTAGVAAFFLLRSRNKPESLQSATAATLLLALASVAAMAKTGHEGGKIMHPEIRGDLPAQGAAEHDDND